MNAPLWSDGADKERFLALPDNARIRVLPDDDWDLPSGSVLIKTFWLDGKRIETRLFVRHRDGGWAGYSYEWNPAETDATLVHEGGKSVFIGDVDWYYPSRNDCLKCHTPEAGGTLGLETAQLNGDFTYPNGRRGNQLATFAQIGLFEAPLRDPVQALPRLPDPASGAEPLEDRVRAYLHGNCAGCHRPGVEKSQSLDLRYWVKLADTMACGVEPRAGDLGLGPSGRIVVPGKPDESLLAIRMEVVNSNRMPPLATKVVDDAGLDLVKRWISSLTQCP